MFKAKETTLYKLEAQTHDVVVDGSILQGTVRQRSLKPVRVNTRADERHVRREIKVVGSKPWQAKLQVVMYVPLSGVRGLKQESNQQI